MTECDTNDQGEAKPRTGNHERLRDAIAEAQRNAPHLMVREIYWSETGGWSVEFK
jgi:hypothetical protein